MRDRTLNLIRALHNKHGTYNPFQIIEMEGISVKYVPFKKSTRGLYTMIIDKPTIFLNEELEVTKERFFVASHELCHALEHEDISGYYTLNSRNRSTLEHQANLFAFKLCFNLYSEEHGHKPTSLVDIKYNYGVPLNISSNLIHSIFF